MAIARTKKGQFRKGSRAAAAARPRRRRANPAAAPAVKVRRRRNPASSQAFSPAKVKGMGLALLGGAVVGGIMAGVRHVADPKLTAKAYNDGLIGLGVGAGAGVLAAMANMPEAALGAIGAGGAFAVAGFLDEMGDKQNLMDRRLAAGTRATELLAEQKRVEAAQGTQTAAAGQSPLMLSSGVTRQRVLPAAAAAVQRATQYQTKSAVWG